MMVCPHCREQAPAGARACPACGKKLGTAGDFAAVLFLVGGSPAWCFLLWSGLRSLHDGSRTAGAVMVGLALAGVAAAGLWLWRR